MTQDAPNNEASGTDVFISYALEAALLEMQQEARDEAKQEGLAIVYYALGKKAEPDLLLADMLKDRATDEMLGPREHRQNRFPWVGLAD